MTVSTQNKARLAAFTEGYDPITGEGSLVSRFKYKGYYLPSSMFNDEKFNLIKDMPAPIEVIMEVVNELRNKHDFEYWAYTKIKIVGKQAGKPIKFLLNAAQRIYLATLEDLRMSGQPIRIILLKARQWGGSTLTQIYALWLQNEHHEYWNSCIVGDVESQARTIRAMYSIASREFPNEYGSITLNAFEGSSKNRIVKETNCVISIGSYQKPESLRSGDLKICHLSEIGLWKATEGKKPEDLIQTLTGTVPLISDTMIVMESTAKGVGNYFHNHYKSSKAGDTGYTCVFIAWYMFGDNRLPIKEEEYQSFYDGLSDYEQFLWNEGATLEGIKWYRAKLAELDGDSWRMKSENPTTETEAFQSTGHRAFPIEYVERNRKYNKKPLFVGDYKADSNNGPEALENIEWHNNPRGSSKMWAEPEEGFINRYSVTVDIGGTSKDSDPSIITVLDRVNMIGGGKPEAIFTCELHQDVDIVIWKAAAIAKMYDNALLIVEKNSLNRKKDAGENYLTSLGEIADEYDNVYKRTEKEDEEQDGAEVKYGFHTNKQTKPMIVKQYKAILRDEGYIERDAGVLDEADIYEEKEDGSYGNVVGKGNHDDKLITRMIGLHICFHVMEPCKKREHRISKKRSKPNLAKF